MRFAAASHHRRRSRDERTTRLADVGGIVWL
jgi:hypothetical protein